MIYFVIALIVILLDQATKWLIVTRMEIGDTIPVIGDFFSIASHRNTGAAFSILQGQRWFFITVTLVVVAGLVWYLYKLRNANKRLFLWSLALLLGGAMGNLIDRMMTGEVVDFLKFHFRFDWFGTPVDYVFPIFNLADSSITIGVALFILDTLLEWRKEKREETHEPQQS